jgi:hypothetical protein
VSSQVIELPEGKWRYKVVLPSGDGRAYFLAIRPDKQIKVWTYEAGVRNLKGKILNEKSMQSDPLASVKEGQEFIDEQIVIFKVLSFNQALRTVKLETYEHDLGQVN